MRLDQATWPEVEAYLSSRKGIFLPVGSTEQHGPIGLIGTDAICAENIAMAAATQSGAYVAPTLAYTPAPFNAQFPGTVSVSVEVFTQVFGEILQGLQSQGFAAIYVLNAHGANLAPMQRVAIDFAGVRIRSWWDFGPVNALRDALYGDWEGMHATPAEVAITQALYRVVHHPDAEQAPRRLGAEEKARRAGDNHGSAALHKQEFPDGRVGSHSALARPEHGRRMLQAAADAVSADFLAFCTEVSD